jgi:hypothetical protein
MGCLLNPRHYVLSRSMFTIYSGSQSSSMSRWTLSRAAQTSGSPASKTPRLWGVSDLNDRLVTFPDRLSRISDVNPADLFIK